jgi:hypothetical protein
MPGAQACGVVGERDEQTPQTPLRHDGIRLGSAGGCHVTGTDGSPESYVDRHIVNVEAKSASESESSGGVGVGVGVGDKDGDDGVVSASVATAEAWRLPSVPLESYTRWYLVDEDVPVGTAASDLFALGRTIASVLQVGVAGAALWQLQARWLTLRLCSLAVAVC